MRNNKEFLAVKSQPFFTIYANGIFLVLGITH